MEQYYYRETPYADVADDIQLIAKAIVLRKEEKD